MHDNKTPTNVVRVVFGARKAVAVPTEGQAAADARPVATASVGDFGARRVQKTLDDAMKEFYSSAAIAGTPHQA